jgi:hypothetical protein
MRKKRMGKDEKREVTPEFVNMSKEILYPQIQGVTEGLLGIDPHWDLWTHLFSAEPFAWTTGEKRVRMAVRAGGCILQLRQVRAQQYIPAILVSSNKGW